MMFEELMLTDNVYKAIRKIVDYHGEDNLCHPDDITKDSVITPSRVLLSFREDFHPARKEAFYIEKEHDYPYGNEYSRTYKYRSLGMATKYKLIIPLIIWAILNDETTEGDRLHLSDYSNTIDGIVFFEDIFDHELTGDDIAKLFPILFNDRHLQEVMTERQFSTDNLTRRTLFLILNETKFWTSAFWINRPFNSIATMVAKWEDKSVDEAQKIRMPYPIMSHSAYVKNRMNDFEFYTKGLLSDAIMDEYDESGLLTDRARKSYENAYRICCDVWTEVAKRVERRNDGKYWKKLDKKMKPYEMTQEYVTEIRDRAFAEFNIESIFAYAKDGVPVSDLMA